MRDPLRPLFFKSRGVARLDVLVVPGSDDRCVLEILPDEEKTKLKIQTTVELLKPVRSQRDRDERRSLISATIQVQRQQDKCRGLISATNKTSAEA